MIKEDGRKHISAKRVDIVSLRLVKESSLLYKDRVRYKQHLLDHEFKISTINKKVNSLKVFNDFLQLKGIVDSNYIQLRKDRVPIATGSEQVVEALNDAEVERVLAFVRDETKVSVRNRLRRNFMISMKQINLREVLFLCPNRS